MAGVAPDRGQTAVRMAGENRIKLDPAAAESDLDELRKKGMCGGIVGVWTEIGLHDHNKRGADSGEKTRKN